MNQTEKSQYKKSIIFLIAVIVAYVLVAIGDVVMKGYSKLPAYPIIIAVIAIGWLGGTYIRKSKRPK